jgi:hypothetical protein
MLPVLRPVGNENASKCNFINTEINHDLNPPVSVATSRNLHFQTIARTNLNAGTHGCGDNPYNLEFKNDDEIVKLILGVEKHVLYDPTIYSSNTEHELHVMNAKPDNRIQSEIVIAKFKKYHKPYNNDLFGLFSHIPVEGPINPNYDVFFVIDTGDNLVTTFKGLTNIDATRIPNIHVIHSQVTLADSAPKTKPDASDYDSDNKTVNIYSWYWNNQIIIPHNDPLFLSNYQITHNIGVGWSIRQTWNLPGAPPAYNTNSPKVDNDKKVIREYLKSKNINNELVAIETNPVNKAEVSLNIQKKRSGDHLQIWFAKNFPRLATPSLDNTNLTYVRGPTATAISSVAAAAAAAVPATPIELAEAAFLSATIADTTAKNNVLTASTADKPAARLAAKNAANALYAASARVKEIPARERMTNHITDDYYRLRTIFITGDWPAFAYAIYNRVNSIMVFKHPTDQTKSSILYIYF